MSKSNSRILRRAIEASSCVLVALNVVLFSIVFSTFSEPFVISKAWAEGPKKEDGWKSKVAKLNGVESKVKDLNQQMEALIKAKHSVREEAEKTGMIVQLKELEAQRNTEVEKYNSIRYELKYRYPERDDFTERRYLPMRQATAEDMEKDLNIDDQLTRVRRKVEVKYAPILRQEASEKAKPILPSQKETAPSDIKKLKLSK